MRGKMTPAVRRVILSQKTFANHLADEEAALANAAQTEQAQPAAAATAAAPTTTAPPVPAPPGRPAGKATRGRPRLSSTAQVTSTNTTTSAPPTPAPPPPSQPTNPTAPSTLSAGDSQDDPLLRSHLPPLPTAEDIDALLAAPPLPYSAARAAPTMSSAPARRFCDMCGYWGRAKCMKCGVRVCALDCLRLHEETRCLKFYA